LPDLQTKSLCHVVSFMLSGVISEPIDYLLAVTPTNSLVLSGELQEEIMWMAEAAHVPVIWATQLLENVAKTGQPSRAEITDAAMAERAECVMLNKGPYVVQAVEMLDDALTRMRAHQMKKVSLLRQLDVAHRFCCGEGA
jgi:pyruvate kinase